MYLKFGQCANLNTSNVTVNQKKTKEIINLHTYLNTSNVTVNLKERLEQIGYT